MPIYEYKCSCGTNFERYLPVDKYREPQQCECGNIAEKQISRLLMARVMPDVCYDSPITGKAITSMAQRREDMARSGCIEYDPEMKTDYNRRIAREEAELEQKFDNSIEKAIATLPTKKRETLEQELQHGADAEITRHAKDSTNIH